MVGLLVGHWGLCNSDVNGSMGGCGAPPSAAIFGCGPSEISGEHLLVTTHPGSVGSDRWDGLIFSPIQWIEEICLQGGSGEPEFAKFRY